MTRQERKDPLLERSDERAARRARKRSLFIGLGLVALSGTSLFAAVDQFRLREAAASPPCQIQEELRAVVPAVFTKAFLAPVTQPIMVTSASAVHSAEIASTPATSGSSDLAHATVPASALVHASAVRDSEWNGVRTGSAAPGIEAVRWGEPEATGALAPFRNASRSSRAALATRTPSGADCPSAQIRDVLADISARFGPLTVVATDQQKTANHRSGSIRQKLHQDCKAVDFRPERSRIDEIKAYLRNRRDIDGVESYRDGVIHIDASSRRAPVTAAVRSRGPIAFSHRSDGRLLE